MLGRELETILNLIPREERREVWDYFRNNLVNTDEREGFDEASPDFAAPVDMSDPDSVVAMLQEAGIDSKQILLIMLLYFFVLYHLSVVLNHQGCDLANLYFYHKN